MVIVTQLLLFICICMFIEFFERRKNKIDNLKTLRKGNAAPWWLCVSRNVHEFQVWSIQLLPFESLVCLCPLDNDYQSSLLIKMIGMTFSLVFFLPSLSVPNTGRCTRPRCTYTGQVLLWPERIWPCCLLPERLLQSEGLFSLHVFPLSGKIVWIQYLRCPHSLTLNFLSWITWLLNHFVTFFSVRWEKERRWDSGQLRWGLVCLELLKLN